MPRVVRMAAAVAIFAVATAPASAQVLLANPTANNGGAVNWAIFFDLSASGADVTVTELTTASTAAANAALSFEVFTRVGTGLGGPVTGGPGSDPTGWTSLGVVNGTQGPTASGISLPIDIPDIAVADGMTVGVALRFLVAGPRYFGTGAAPLQTFTDGPLTLVTGDSRSAPFTTTGSFFSSRALAGSLTYTAVPEPSSMALASVAGFGLAAIRRRRSRASVTA